jgi:hypothetical protein
MTTTLSRLAYRLVGKAGDRQCATLLQGEVGGFENLKIVHRQATSEIQIARCACHHPRGSCINRTISTHDAPTGKASRSSKGFNRVL